MSQNVLSLAHIAEARRQPFSWRDPIGVRHILTMYKPIPIRGVQPLCFVTWCGLTVTVDDLNNRTKVYYAATCMRCTIAPEIPDVIPGE